MPNRRSFGRTGLLIALLLAAVAQPANAQDFSADEIVEALTPVKPGPVTRDIRGVTVEEAEDLPPPSINLRVQFAFDSDRLENEAMIALRALGQALADPRLADYRFDIIGHTDAKGTDAYNLDLSTRRAAAVREHLVFFYDIDPARLVSDGRGESELFDPANPEGGVNRRVEIVNLLE